MNGIPEEVERLARKRAEAREARDFGRADMLRDRIAAAGWSVVDEPKGFRLERLDQAEPQVARTVPASEVSSVLEDPPTTDASVHWVVEGWPEDVERALAAFRTHAAGRSIQFVVADLTGADPGRWEDDVDVLSLPADTGWAAARNAGLKRSTGRVVLAVDGSIEPVGDVVGPLESALEDPGVGIAGPFGVVTRDLREFEEAPGPGDCDAIEGYLMAFRRDVLSAVGLFDEKFKWYRTADIEYSFRVKDAGFRTVVVPVPVERHEHQMWFNTLPSERAKWSKRNFYRFLDRWRDRWDLCISPEPTGSGATQDDAGDRPVEKS